MFIYSDPNSDSNARNWTRKFRRTSERRDKLIQIDANELLRNRSCRHESSITIQRRQAVLPEKVGMARAASSHWNPISKKVEAEKEHA